MVLLAAGGSTRLGKPKQLVPWRGSTLLRRAAQTALDARLGTVVVLLGAGADDCAAELSGLPVEIVRHPRWAEGMGSTIARAIGHLIMGHPRSDAVVLMACDQPLVTAEDLRALHAAHLEQARPMAAAGYADTMGIPALFAREMFGTLSELRGEAGAASLLRTRPDSVAVVPCPAAATDVDGPGDIGRLP